MGFLWAWAFGLSTPLALGLVLISAVPGGAHSNLYSSFAKADIALSVTLTALSGVITIVTIPLVLSLAIAVFAVPGEVPPMPIGATMLQIFFVMGLPVALGMLLRARSERWAKRLEGPVKGAAALLLVLIILGSLRGNGDKLAAAALSSGAAVVALNVSSMLLGWGLARLAGLSVPQQLTITLEVGIQNATLAFALGLALLRGDLSLPRPVGRPDRLRPAPRGPRAGRPLYERFGKAIKGGNNLVIDTIHDDGPEIPLRMAPMVLVGTVLTHLFGGSAGREGTAVQMGASLADAISHRIGVSSAVRRQLLAAGVAGGFGSVFGTPIAGTVFGLEFVSLGRIEYDALIPALVAALVGDVTTRAWGVGHTPTPRRRASRSTPCWR
jgi:hypothetical protein